MYKKFFEEQRKLLIDQKINSVLEKYGGREHLEIPEEIRQRLDTVRYNEFNETGIVKQNEIYEKSKVIKKAPCVRGHVHAWGSYYHKLFGWGYKCCYSLDYYSICKGEKQKSYNLNIIKKREEKEEKNLTNDETIKIEKTELTELKNDKTLNNYLVVNNEKLIGKKREIS
jgi:pre-mRNA-processing factor SLU7